MARGHDSVGSRIGPRIAMLISQAMIYTHSRLVHVKHRLAMMVFHAISDEISEEVDVTLGPILAKLHALTPEDHPAYPAIHFMHTASGQLKALAGTGLQISGLLGSISTVMNNELAPVVYEYVKTNPHLLPDASTVLQLHAAGLIDPGLFNDAMGSQGINAGWAESMSTLAKTWPDLTTSLELVRRGKITPDQLAQWASYNGIDPAVTGILLNLVRNPISPADAALAVLRGNISQAQADAIATENGITPADFQTLVNNTGEPPGTQELLEAYRRGFIDQAQLERGIRQSRYRDEWISTLEKLRYSPMSVADAVDATVQAQLDPSSARDIADQNGLTPGAFDVLLATAGEPLSRTELEQLYDRGLIDKATVIQGLRESRLKMKYNELAFELHSKILPIYTIQNALRRGGMDQAQAVASIMANGYSKADATAIVTSASQEQLQTYRDKVVTAVAAMYEDNLISESQAGGTIKGLGFTADQVKFITQSSEFRREAKMIQTAVNAIRAKYLGHHIALNDASGYLDSLGLPSAQRDQLLALWQVEYGAYTRELTEAQVAKAVKLNLITADEGQARLVAMGYNAADAALLLEGA